MVDASSEVDISGETNIIKIGGTGVFDAVYTNTDYDDVEKYAEVEHDLSYNAKLVNSTGETQTSGVSPSTGNVSLGESISLKVTAPSTAGTYRLVVEYTDKITYLDVIAGNEEKTITVTETKEYIIRVVEAITLSVTVAKTKRCIQTRQNRLGNITLTATTAAGAFVDVFYNACSEKNGRNHLYNRRGLVFFIALMRSAAADVISHAMTLEHAYIALATIKNNTLFKHCNSLNLLRTSCANASLEHKFYIKTNIHRVKTAVKTNGIDIDTRPNDFRTFCSDRAGML